MKTGEITSMTAASRLTVPNHTANRILLGGMRRAAGSCRTPAASLSKGAVPNSSAGEDSPDNAADATACSTGGVSVNARLDGSGSG